MSVLDMSTILSSNSPRFSKSSPTLVAGWEKNRESSGTIRAPPKVRRSTRNLVDGLWLSDLNGKPRVC